GSGEEEMLLVRVEAQQERASSARGGQHVRQEKRRRRGEVGRFRQRGEERETSALGRRRQSAFSSFSLMLTKLYGGHGPEYLNDRTSSYLRLVSLTRSSNACSCARSTRKAALSIMRSPIGLLDRLATATDLRAS